MTLKVHLLPSFDQDRIDKLKDCLDDDIELTCGLELPSPAAYSILIAGVPTRDAITASPNLKTLIIPWSGLPVATRELMLEFPDIAIHNIHHNAAPAAETAIMLMMAAAKLVIPIDRAFRAHDWRPRYDYDGSAPGGPLLLEGKTALILGYGAIGRKIAKICQGLEMRVMAIKNDIPSYSDSSVELYALKALSSLLPRAEVLFVCLPMTPETRGLIGKKQLALLPPEAIIVNIARGSIIDEAALYATLASDRKNGGPCRRAGLDVWYHYPKDESSRTGLPPSEFPFHELDNVVMTPHLGGHSDATESLRIAALAELLNKAAHGKILPNHVDPERGY